MTGLTKSNGSKSGLRNSGEDAGLTSIFLMTNYFETGGTERQFALLARAFRLGGFQVRLGCLSRKGTFAEGLGDIAEFSPGGSFFTLQCQRARIALARHLRAQAVRVAHSFDFYTNMMLIPTARLAGVPVVLGSRRQLGDLLTPLQFRVENAMFRLCDRVVFNSRAAADRLLELGFPKCKLAVIPNGLPEEAFAKNAPALAPSPGVLRVGMIARMNHSVKNHPCFLRAAARLAGRFPTVEFVLVGDGPLRPGLEQMASELGLGHRARFLGERHDIPAVLAAMDISVLCSSSESLSNVILESMAAGVPVVATRVGGNPEIVVDGETGLLVPPDDDGKLAEALECLLTRAPLRSALGRRGQLQAQANFSLERIRSRYEDLYGELLAEKGRQPRLKRPDMRRGVNNVV